jgi:hypothetical protein
MKTKFKNFLTLSTSLFLMFAVAFPFVSLPSVDAHTPPYNLPSFAFIVANPNPVGVGQPVYISMWVDRPMPDSYVDNDIRRRDYTLTITKPDGNKLTQHWDVIQDTTGIAFYKFTPDIVGEYALRFDYGGQVFTWGPNTPSLTSAKAAYQNDTFAPASKIISLTVQQEPLSNVITSYPLPTEYWTRPIEAQNTAWGTISSNWLATHELKSRVQPDGIAPNSAHIMWTKPLDTGGVVGGTFNDIQGEGFYMGGSYNTRWTAGFGTASPIIMNGVLYYELPEGNAPGGGGYIAVDVRTGKQLWFNRQIGAVGSGLLVPSFGYYYDFQSENQHGVIPQGALFSADFAQAYNPLTGELWFNVTGVPATQVLGSRGEAEAYGTNGEILRYVIDSQGKWLAQWNSTAIFGGSTIGAWGLDQPRGVDEQRQTIDSSEPIFYDWNVTIPNLGPGEWGIAGEGGQGGYPTQKLIDVDNMLILIQTVTVNAPLGGTGWVFQDTENYYGANVTAVSLKPESRGQVLWAKQYPVAPGNVSRYIATWDPKIGVFVTVDMETMQHNGWSLQNGEHLWGPTTSVSGYDYFNNLFTARTAYGNLYYAGYGGVLYSWDIKTGAAKWTYGNGGVAGNNTFDVQQPWGHRPIFISTIADDKVYLLSTEHSPNTPLYKDALVHCVNATDGAEIWTIMGWGTGMHATASSIVADGYLVYLNCYDMQVYSIGKGPSATTVDAPMTAIQLGQSVVIRGTVTDIAAGTRQDEQAARFPNGVPAVSDASIGRWMEYVYMQKPRPTDVTGVPVTISVVDANGNYREIGSTETYDGFFTLNWKPDIEGQYTVYASFAGSESYYGSSALTSFAVDSSVATATPQATQIPSAADLYFIPAIVGVIIAIVVVGAVLALLVTKKP